MVCAWYLGLVVVYYCSTYYKAVREVVSVLSLPVTGPHAGLGRTMVQKFSCVLSRRRACSGSVMARRSCFIDPALRAAVRIAKKKLTDTTHGCSQIFLSDTPHGCG